MYIYRCTLFYFVRLIAIPFAVRIEKLFAEGVSIHNSRVSSVLGFKRRLQIERRSHYVVLLQHPQPLQSRAECGIASGRSWGEEEYGGLLLS